MAPINLFLSNLSFIRNTVKVLWLYQCRIFPGKNSSQGLTVANTAVAIPKHYLNRHLLCCLGLEPSLFIRSLLTNSCSPPTLPLLQYSRVYFILSSSSFFYRANMIEWFCVFKQQGKSFPVTEVLRDLKSGYWNDVFLSACLYFSDLVTYRSNKETIYYYFWFVHLLLIISQGIFIFSIALNFSLSPKR